MRDKVGDEAGKKKISLIAKIKSETDNEKNALKCAIISKSVNYR